MSDNQTTVVSCFYEIPSKRPAKDYLEQWIPNFLQIKSPIVIFTEHKFVTLFKFLNKLLIDG